MNGIENKEKEKEKGKGKFSILHAGGRPLLVIDVV
jgi:hypothetical protein